MGENRNIDNAALGEAILSLGEPDFGHALLSAMEPFVPVDHLAVTYSIANKPSWATFDTLSRGTAGRNRRAPDAA